MAQWSITKNILTSSQLYHPTTTYHEFEPHHLFFLFCTAYHHTITLHEFEPQHLLYLFARHTTRP